MAAEESVDPVRDMPKGILLALGTLIATAFLDCRDQSGNKWCRRAPACPIR